MILILISLLSLAHCMDNGLGLTPPLGWNTWKTCEDEHCTHDFCNETEIKQIAQAMIDNGMQKVGYNYVNLDDCWADLRDNTTHKLTWDTERFPNGIPSLIDWLHSKGFKFGLYTSAGNQTCSSGGRPYPIPGSEGHYDLDAQTFADWGVDYVKLDWCGDIHDHIFKGQTAHKEFAAAMNKTGKPMYLEVVAGYLFFLSDEIRNYANSWRFCEDHHDQWSSTSEAILCRLDQFNVTGAPEGWAYMDFLMTGGQGCNPYSKGAHCPGQTDEEYRTAFTIWAITQSPLLVATDVREMSPIMNKALLNNEIIGIHQDTTTSPGKKIGYWTCEEWPKCQVWGRKIKEDGSQWMIALVNMGDNQHKLTLEWNKIGFETSKSAIVYDLWNHSTIGTYRGSYESDEIPSHGSVVLKVTLESEDLIN